MYFTNLRVLHEVDLRNQFIDHVDKMNAFTLCEAEQIIMVYRYMGCVS